MLVVDTGPFIALAHAADRDHLVAARGFRVLGEAHERLIVSAVVVFELYKWLLFESGPVAAQQGVRVIQRAAEIRYPAPSGLHDAIALATRLRNWRGSLEDATVALLALQTGVALWTLNDRDFSAFPGLQFWTPP